MKYNGNADSTILSVIVPIYNAAPFLEKCITSITMQTFRDMEIILVDDGSTDNSLEICKRYQGMDTRIKVISKKNGGLISARKAGVSAADSELIGFVDSDDWIEENMYEELVQCYVQTGCDLVSSGIIRDYENFQRTVQVMDHYEEGLYEDLEDEIYPSMLYSREYCDYGLYPTLVNKLFRKDKLADVYEGIDEAVFYGEDALTLYSYCMSISQIYIKRKAYYHYNIRSGSMCSTPDRRLPYNTYLLYTGLKKVFTQSEQSAVLMKQLKKYVLDLEFHNLKTLYHINMAVFDQWEFEYPEELFSDAYVIYGAGACGQALFREIEEMHKEQNMVAWVDKDADALLEECLYEVQTPEILCGLSYDYIIVAVKNENTAKEIIAELTDLYQIKREKLIWKPAKQVIRHS
ncbi:glycosyltransferase family 2 protein [bacterium 0.1xD8-71]|nr:glycosyltransferase family 2 protein [bacterium 0.1xD8-71]